MTAQYDNTQTTETLKDKRDSFRSGIEKATFEEQDVVPYIRVGSKPRDTVHTWTTEHYKEDGPENPPIEGDTIPPSAPDEEVAYSNRLQEFAKAASVSLMSEHGVTTHSNLEKMRRQLGVKMRRIMQLIEITTFDRQRSAAKTATIGQRLSSIPNYCYFNFVGPDNAALAAGGLDKGFTNSVVGGDNEDPVVLTQGALNSMCQKITANGGARNKKGMWLVGNSVLVDKVGAFAGDSQRYILAEDKGKGIDLSDEVSGWKSRSGYRFKFMSTEWMRKHTQNGKDAYDLLMLDPKQLRTHWSLRYKVLPYGRQGNSTAKLCESIYTISVGDPRCHAYFYSHI